MPTRMHRGPPTRNWRLQNWRDLLGHAGTILRESPSRRCSMKLIDYDKYQKKWTPRGTILLLVVEAASTGLFLGSGVIETARRQDVWTWVLPLALGFLSGVATLQATLVALHNCAPSP